jgi:hypothetical protein
MAAGDASPSRFGLINQAGTADALFYQIFTGEVLEVFEKALVMNENRMTIRTITHGKSAAFGAMGDIAAAYHTPGAVLTGTTVNHNEIVITIDGKLLAQAFIADIDEAKAEYDVRSRYTHKMGYALAKQWDIDAFIELILSARNSTPIVTGGAGTGTVISDAAFDSAVPATQATAIAKAFFTAAQTMDEKDVPSEGRYICLKPSLYYALLNNRDVLDKAYGTGGNLAEGRVNYLAGIEIVKSNNIPSTNITGVTHNADCTKTRGVGGTKEGVATVKLMGLRLQSEYEIQRQGTLLVASYAIGVGKLRPECAVELAIP